jgi:hypothetical protein
MPDIRAHPEFLDDFQRPDEDPIEPPWIQTPGATSTATHFLENGRMESHGDGQYRYTGAGGGPFDASTASIEVWGLAGPGIDLTEAWRIGFLTSDCSGYMCLINNNIGDNVWQIRSYSGGNFTVINEAYFEEFPGYVLVRIGEGVLESYYSADAQTWILINSAALGITSGLYLMLGVSSDDSGNPSWEGFGGGIIERWLPSFLRRQGG